MVTVTYILFNNDYNDWFLLRSATATSQLGLKTAISPQLADKMPSLALKHSSQEQHDYVEATIAREFIILLRYSYDSHTNSWSRV